MVAGSMQAVGGSFGCCCRARTHANVAGGDVHAVADVAVQLALGGGRGVPRWVATYIPPGSSGGGGGSGGKSGGTHHKGLAEALDLGVALALGLKVRPALHAAGTG